MSQRHHFTPAPPSFHIVEHCLTTNTQRHPHKDALVFLGDHPDDDETWSFQEIEELVARVATAFVQTGLPKGTRVMLQLPNHIDWVVVFLGALSVGWVPLTASMMLTPRELKELLTRADAKWLIRHPTDTWHRELEADVADLIVHTREDIASWKQTPRAPSRSLPLYKGSADDPAFLIFTSGTTGHPKGVLHAHRSVWGRQPMHQGWMGVDENDRLLHAGQLNWTYTLGVGLLDPWACGATAYLYAGANPSRADWQALLERSQATLFASVPGLYRKLLNQLEEGHTGVSPWPHLRHGLVAGEALSPALLERWQRRTGTPLYEALGMSEISTYISSGPNTPIKKGSPGRPQPGRRVAIVAAKGTPTLMPPGEVGLLAVHHSEPGLMLGYLPSPDDAPGALEEEVFRGEWFCGGDLASMDEEGYIWFHGRHDDVLTAMGYRVSPLEVEKVLVSHPEIAEAALTQEHVKEDVVALVAYIVPADAGTDRESLITSLKEWMEERLAAYKRPRTFRWLEQLPRTPNGKLKRSQLRTLTKESP